jgi:phosphatidylserine/phosphatidylglycerophosphate/cardiolipin synthase-like enzyme
MTMATLGFNKIDKVICANWRAFRKPGVLSVRPGFKFTGGWITDKPAIVVTVEKKRDVPQSARLPAQVGGVAIDVRQATPLDHLRHTDPTAHAVLAAARPEWAPPPSPFERTVKGTTKPAAPLGVAARLPSNPTKPQLPYTAPQGASLAMVTDVMTITCHASPDAGWPTLSQFLDGIRTRLTVGMYDFTSAHILQKLEQSLASAKATLQLVLDHPGRDRTADQTDEQTRQALEQNLTGKAQVVWALTDKDPRVTKWIYPTSYHIKVAVRDGTAFWLSSGNWNNSNQPDINPLTNPTAAAAVAKKSDRDWHVIVEHPGLAATFEQFLKNDWQVASLWQGTAGVAQQAPVKAAANATAAFVAASVPSQYFPPLVIQNERFTIEPLLTPDNYAASMLTLINSAKAKLYMQMQYIYAPKANDKFQALVDAVKAKMAAGLDVRIILSQYEVQGGALEQLKVLGFDMAQVRIQQNVHNKGVVVDSAVVAVGSHNWSGAGTQTNRDATLIIHHPATAQYFEKVFMHDWTNMAKQKVGL